MFVMANVNGNKTHPRSAEDNDINFIGIRHIFIVCTFEMKNLF